MSAGIHWIKNQSLSRGAQRGVAHSGTRLSACTKHRMSPSATSAPPFIWRALPRCALITVAPACSASFSVLQRRTLQAQLCMLLPTSRRRLYCHKGTAQEFTSQGVPDMALRTLLSSQLA